MAEAGPRRGVAGRLARIVAGFGHQRRRLKAWSPAAYRGALGLALLTIAGLALWL